MPLPADLQQCFDKARQLLSHHPSNRAHRALAEQQGVSAAQLQQGKEDRHNNALKLVRVGQRPASREFTSEPSNLARLTHVVHLVAIESSSHLPSTALFAEEADELLLLEAGKFIANPSIMWMGRNGVLSTVNKTLNMSLSKYQMKGRYNFLLTNSGGRVG